MRVRKHTSEIVEGDLTPMIDMTFQLIAFFMVLINFSQTEQVQGVQLPDSTLAKPPDAPFEFPIIINIKEGGVVVMHNNERPINGLTPLLRRETSALTYDGKTPADATVIIRADREAKTGDVQEVIKICQENKFVNFALRAKEDVGNSGPALE